MCAVQSIIISREPASLYQTIGPRASEVHRHDTRRASDWTLPRIRTESGRRRLCYRGLSMMNTYCLDTADPTFRSTLKSVMRANRI